MQRAGAKLAIVVSSMSFTLACYLYYLITKKDAKITEMQNELKIIRHINPQGRPILDLVSDPETITSPNTQLQASTTQTAAAEGSSEIKEKNRSSSKPSNKNEETSVIVTRPDDDSRPNNNTNDNNPVINESLFSQFAMMLCQIDISGGQSIATDFWRAEHDKQLIKNNKLESDINNKKSKIEQLNEGLNILQQELKLEKERIQNIQKRYQQDLEREKQNRMQIQRQLSDKNQAIDDLRESYRESYEQEKAGLIEVGNLVLSKYDNEKAAHALTMSELEKERIQRNDLQNKLNDINNQLEVEKNDLNNRLAELEAKFKDEENVQIYQRQELEKEKQERIQKQAELTEIKSQLEVEKSNLRKNITELQAALKDNEVTTETENKLHAQTDNDMNSATRKIPFCQTREEFILLLLKNDNKPAFIEQILNEAKEQVNSSNHRHYKQFLALNQRGWLNDVMAPLIPKSHRRLKLDGREYQALAVGNEAIFATVHTPSTLDVRQCANDVNNFITKVKIRSEMVVSSLEKNKSNLKSILDNPRNGGDSFSRWSITASNYENVFIENVSYYFILQSCQSLTNDEFGNLLLKKIIANNCLSKNALVTTPLVENALNLGINEFFENRYQNAVEVLSGVVGILELSCKKFAAWPTEFNVLTEARRKVKRILLKAVACLIYNETKHSTLNEAVSTMAILELPKSPLAIIKSYLQSQDAPHEEFHRYLSLELLASQGVYHILLSIIEQSMQNVEAMHDVMIGRIKFLTDIEIKRDEEISKTLANQIYYHQHVLKCKLIALEYTHSKNQSDWLIEQFEQSQKDLLVIHHLMTPDVIFNTNDSKIIYHYLSQPELIARWCEDHADSLKLFLIKLLQDNAFKDRKSLASCFLIYSSLSQIVTMLDVRSRHTLDKLVYGIEANTISIVSITTNSNPIASTLADKKDDITIQIPTSFEKSLPVTPDTNNLNDTGISIQFVLPPPPPPPLPSEIKQFSISVLKKSQVQDFSDKDKSTGYMSELEERVRNQNLRKTPVINIGNKKERSNKNSLMDKILERRKALKEDENDNEVDEDWNDTSPLESTEIIGLTISTKVSNHSIFSSSAANPQQPKQTNSSQSRQRGTPAPPSRNELDEVFAKRKIGGKK